MLIQTIGSYRTESSPAIEQERQRQRLANIVQQLRANEGQQTQEMGMGSPGILVDGDER